MANVIQGGLQGPTLQEVHADSIKQFNTGMQLQEQKRQFNEQMAFNKDQAKVNRHTAMLETAGANHNLGVLGVLHDDPFGAQMYLEDTLGLSADVAGSFTKFIDHMYENPALWKPDMLQDAMEAMGYALGGDGPGAGKTDVSAGEASLEAAMVDIVGEEFFAEPEEGSPVVPPVEPPAPAQAGPPPEPEIEAPVSDPVEPGLDISAESPGVSFTNGPPARRDPTGLAAPGPAPAGVTVDNPQTTQQGVANPAGAGAAARARAGTPDIVTSDVSAHGTGGPAPVAETVAATPNFQTNTETVTAGTDFTFSQLSRMAGPQAWQTFKQENSTGTFAEFKASLGPLAALWTAGGRFDARTDAAKPLVEQMDSALGILNEGASNFRNTTDAGEMQSPTTWDDVQAINDPGEGGAATSGDPPPSPEGAPLPGVSVDKRNEPAQDKTTPEQQAGRTFSRTPPTYDQRTLISVDDRNAVGASMGLPVDTWSAESLTVGRRTIPEVPQIRPERVRQAFPGLKRFSQGIAANFVNRFEEAWARLKDLGQSDEKASTSRIAQIRMRAAEAEKAYKTWTNADSLLSIPTSANAKERFNEYMENIANDKATLTAWFLGGNQAAGTLLQNLLPQNLESMIEVTIPGRSDTVIAPATLATFETLEDIRKKAFENESNASETGQASALLTKARADANLAWAKWEDYDAIPDEWRILEFQQNLNKVAQSISESAVRQTNLKLNTQQLEQSIQYYGIKQYTDTLQSMYTVTGMMGGPAFDAGEMTQLRAMMDDAMSMLDRDGHVRFDSESGKVIAEQIKAINTFANSVTGIDGDIASLFIVKDAGNNGYSKRDQITPTWSGDLWAALENNDPASRLILARELTNSLMQDIFSGLGDVGLGTGTGAPAPQADPVDDLKAELEDEGVDTDFMNEHF